MQSDWWSGGRVDSLAVMESAATINSAMKLRLASFVLAIALLVSLIIWAVLTSSRRMEESRDQLTLAESESFDIASHLQKATLALNDLVLNFAFRGATNDWRKFEQDWMALNSWIDQQHLAAPAEREVLDRINAAYDDYFAAARQIERTAATNAQAGIPPMEFAQFQNQASRMLNLAFQLADAHRKTLVASVADSTESLRHLSTLLLGALFLLLAFGLWLAILVYRQLISPLKVKR